MIYTKQEKAREYKKLITDVKEAYAKPQIYYNRKGEKKLELTWCDDCQEINLWTYWQGYRYAERTPDVEIMIVGQDFGNPNGSFGEGNNLSKLFNGRAKDNWHYTNGIPKEKLADTDRNLIELFKRVFKKDIEVDCPELFFTNLCLGYRTGNDTGNMTTAIMNKDGEFFKRLVDIAQPEKIICLGRITYEAAIKALNKKYPKISNGYNDYIAKGNKEHYTNGDYSCIIYPSAHTGSLGVLNRNRTNGDMKNGLKTVEDDWKSYLD